MKTCSKCGKDFPESGFYKRKGKARADCKTCFNAATNRKGERKEQENLDDPHVVMTLQEIGAALGFSRQHAYRLLSSALRKLKRSRVLQEFAEL